MKPIFLLFFSILLLNNCSAQNDNGSLIINYNAATRGSSVKLATYSSEIIYTTATENKKIALSEIQWNEIKKLVSKIELEKISTLEAPSNQSYTDRALIASLTINKKGETFESATFDHGSPPNELKRLIDFLFEIIN